MKTLKLTQKPYGKEKFYNFGNFNHHQWNKVENSDFSNTMSAVFYHFSFKSSLFGRLSIF